MKLNLKRCVFGASIMKFLGFIRSHKRIEANPEKIRVILEIRLPLTLKEIQV